MNELVVGSGHTSPQHHRAGHRSVEDRSHGEAGPGRVGVEANGSKVADRSGCGGPERYRSPDPARDDRCRTTELGVLQRSGEGRSIVRIPESIDRSPPPPRRARPSRPADRSPRTHGARSSPRYRPGRHHRATRRLLGDSVELQPPSSVGVRRDLGGLESASMQHRLAVAEGRIGGPVAGNGERVPARVAYSGSWNERRAASSAGAARHVPVRSTPEPYRQQPEPEIRDADRQSPGAPLASSTAGLIR